jgi:hypothetical protein
MLKTNLVRWNKKITMADLYMQGYKAAMEKVMGVLVENYNVAKKGYDKNLTPKKAVLETYEDLILMVRFLNKQSL